MRGNSREETVVGGGRRKKRGERGAAGARGRYHRGWSASARPTGLSASTWPIAGRAGRRRPTGCAQTGPGHLLGVGEADRTPSAWTKPTGPARRDGGRGCNIFVIFSKRVLFPEKNKINVLFQKIEPIRTTEEQIFTVCRECYTV